MGLAHPLKNPRAPLQMPPSFLELTEDALATFFAPPPLPENDLQAPFEAASGNPKRYSPRHRRRDLDSGYGSHNVSFPQNRGSTPVRDSSEYNEQPGVATPIPKNFGESDRHKIHDDVSDALWRDLSSNNDFWRDLSPNHFGKELPSLEVFNTVETA
jgi:hypothetical protein